MRLIIDLDGLNFPEGVVMQAVQNALNNAVIGQGYVENANVSLAPMRGIVGLTDRPA